MAFEGGDGPALPELECTLHRHMSLSTWFGKVVEPSERNGSQGVLVRVSLAVERLHDHGHSYKGKHLNEVAAYSSDLHGAEHAGRHGAGHILISRQWALDCDTEQYPEYRRPPSPLPTGTHNLQQGQPPNNTTPYEAGPWSSAI